VKHIYTIGFTKKGAKRFFELLQSAGVKKILDTRLNNTGQLAGFSKRDDLEYFAENLIGARYHHWLDAAPSPELLENYKKRRISWQEYEKGYLALIEGRRIETSPFASDLHQSCLLCTEDKPHHCHRKLLAEYLAARNQGDVTVHHLV
jgi:uncharacterized protein (DUF488 family)